VCELPGTVVKIAGKPSGKAAPFDITVKYDGIVPRVALKYTQKDEFLKETLTI
jgi:hypothetical protein